MCRIVVYFAFKLDHLTKYGSCVKLPSGCVFFGVLFLFFFSSFVSEACIDMCGSTWQPCQANRLVIIGVTISISMTPVFFQS